MANTLRFKRGLASGLPTGLAGEPLFTTDTFDLYIGNGTTNTRFQKYIASGATTQILRGDGSLYTFPLAISSPSNGQVLKYNGTSWVNDSDAGITGSGSAGQVAYFTGATTQAGNNNLFWDNTNARLGVGTNNPSYTFHAISSAATIGAFRNSGAAIGQLLVGNTAADMILRILASGDSLIYSDTGKYLAFGSNGGTERARIFATGNFGIGTGATDSGQRLQVIGDTLLKGSGNTSATTALTVQNSDGNNILRLRNDFTAIFDVAGSSLTISGIANYTILQANQAFYFRSNGATAGRAFKIFDNASSLTGTTGANQNIQSLITFAPTSGTATYTDLDLTSTINQTGGANGITRGLYVRPTLTAAADWRSIEWSNNTGWGLYGAGTANNYMAGSLGIGSTTLAGFNLRVAKNITGGTIIKTINQDGTVQSDVTNLAFSFLSSARTAAASFTLSNYYHFYTEQYTLGAGSAITNQFGFVADNTLTGATNNFGFYGNIAAATGRWNLYMNGTAANFLSGDTSVGTATMRGKFQVKLGVATAASTIASSGFDNTYALFGNPDTTSGQCFGIGAQRSLDGINLISVNPTSDWVDTNYYSRQHIFYGTGTEGMRLTTLRNLHIGTFSSDSGEKLQVTGTMKVTGASTFGGNMLLSLNQNTNTTFTVSNTTSGTFAVSEVVLQSNTVASFGKTSSGYATFKTIVASDFYMYNSGAGDISILNNFATGNIKFAAGGSSTAQMLLNASGNLGLGVTPFSGATVTASLEVANNLTVRSYAVLGVLANGGFGAVGSNYYLDSSNSLRRKNADWFSAMEMPNGGFVWKTAANAAANSTITTSTIMTLTAVGRLILGAGDTGELLQVNGTAKITGATSVTNTITATLNNGSVFNARSGSASGYAYYSVGRTSEEGVWGVAGASNQFFIGAVAGDMFIGANNNKIHFGTNASTAAPYMTINSGSVTIQNNLTVDTNTLFVDATNNRVGVLTATPSTTLDVGGNATIGLTSTTGYSLVVQNSGANDTTGIRLTSGGTDNGYFITAYNSVSKYASLQAGDNTAYRNIVLNLLGGNVGIGISPTEKLHVSGNAIVTGNLTVDTNTLFVDATNNEVGIGTNAPNSVLHVAGSVAKQISSVKTANYTATASDYTILCDATSGGFTVTLPAASGIAGRIYIIKKINASSGVNSVTVDGNASETIDGSATINLSCKSSVMLQCDGSNWHILSLYTDTSCL